MKRFIPAIDSDKSLSGIFETHFNALYNYGLKISKDSQLVEDSIQDLFFRLLIKNFNIESVKNQRYYLLKSLRRQILKTLELKYYQINKVEVNDDCFTEFSPEDYFIQNQSEENLIVRVNKALNQLSDRQREAIYLRYFENLEYEQIAEIMNINYQSVKNNVHRGLVALKDIISLYLFISIAEKFLVK